MFQKNLNKCSNRFQSHSTNLVLSLIFRKLLLSGMLLIFTPTVMAAPNELFVSDDQIDSRQLIQAVLVRNPSIAAMSSAWQAAKNRIDQVSALDDPMLTYSFAPNTRDLDGQELGQKIQLSQKLPWPGKLSLQEDSARFAADVSQTNIELLQLQLIELSVRSFADWYYIHEALRINLLNQDLWQEFRTIAELKYSTGRASKQDALRAEMEQTKLVHQAIVLQRKQKNILARLNTLLNRNPDEMIPPPVKLPAARLLPTVNHLRQAALDKHPALKALIARQQASEVNVNLAELEYFPDFRINASYNSLWAQEEKRYTVGLGINIPLAQGKRNTRVNEKRALAMQLKWKITEKQAEIAGAIQRAYNSVEESRHVLKLYRNKLLPLAEENLQAARSDYQSGKGGFLNLVSAEKDLIQTQLNQVQAQADYHRRLAMLARHVGDTGLLNMELKISATPHSETQGKAQ